MLAKMHASARLNILLVLTFVYCVGYHADADQNPLADAARASQPSLQEKSWKILHAGLNEPKASKRIEAVKALSWLTGNHRATRFAVAALHDKDPHVRTAAAASLGQLHATTAIPDLKQALGDKDILVVLAAAHALYMLKDPSAYGIYYAVLMGDKKSSQGLVQSQLDRLKDPKQMAQMGFQEGLGFVPFGGMGYEAYRTIVRHDSSPVRAAAARFLASDPDPVSRDALVQTALADKNVIVREAAIDALAERGDPSCIKLLSKNLDDDKYPAVRYRTAATIIHLTSGARAIPKKSRYMRSK